MGPSPQEGLLRPCHPGSGSGQKATLTQIWPLSSKPPRVLFFLLVFLSPSHLIDKGESFGKPEIILFNHSTNIYEALPRSLQ